MKNRRNRKARDPEPRRIALRIHLDEEVFKLLEKDAKASQRNRQWHVELLLENAIRASWAYGSGDLFAACRDVPTVAQARDFFAELRDLEAVAMEEIHRAGNTARLAAKSAAVRCQWWLDAEKAHRGRGAGPKVIAGEFRPAPKRSAS